MESGEGSRPLASFSSPVLVKYIVHYYRGYRVQLERALEDYSETIGLILPDDNFFNGRSIAHYFRDQHDRAQKIFWGPLDCILPATQICGGRGLVYEAIAMFIY